MLHNSVLSESEFKRFNILELYSGIGGFHYAIQRLFSSNRIERKYRITAVDINTTANVIYRHNHLNFDEHEGDENFHQLLERNIQSFRADDLDRLRLDLITMSPPCQPFSRLGLKRDLDDKRCDSFRHLMSTLPLLRHKPRFIMLENVKGFETSEAHQLLIETLIVCGYRFEEFLLSPHQFSIPNSRLRYYLIAKRFAVENPDKSEPDIPLLSGYVPNIHTQIPVIDSKVFSIFDSNTHTLFYNRIALNQDLTARIVSNYEDENCLPTIESYLVENGDEMESFALPDETLHRYHMIFDLVDRRSTNSNCFTKAYAHRIEGCGSILKTAPDSITIDDVYASITRDDNGRSRANVTTTTTETKTETKKTTSTTTAINCSNNSIVKLLRTLRLRYFTPREIANLMCFPACFEFPRDINRKQRYRVLGNSVNVAVISYLLRILLFEGDNVDETSLDN